MIELPIPIKFASFVKSEISAITLDSRSGIYDIACIDEKGSHFIVEMQLSDYPEFIQRMKFYAFHRFNTLVKKGKYKFENLSQIYCIGFLANNIFPEIVDYHNTASLKNKKGEIIDDQMTFITVELDKFEKKLFDIHTDLDKLIYTMKTLHKVTKTADFPKFWNEEWLKKAISEVDLRSMNPEQKLAYEMTLSANALVLKNEAKKVKEIKLAEKTEMVEKALSKGLDLSLIADIAGVSISFVEEINKKLIHK